MISPVVDAKYFRKGLFPGHVIGMHFNGRYITGYGGKTAPPFNRYFMGGENDIRGFSIWGISPIAYVPSEAPVTLLNNDGSPRLQRIVNADGTSQFVGVTQNIPSYQLVTPGGDTALIGNFEYRIPIFGPVILAAFFDAGMNRLLNTNQLQINPDRIASLQNSYPDATIPNKAVVAIGTQKIRASTGLELQVMMPVVNAPFRLYWAYNPWIVREFLQSPILSDRSMFPNEASFRASLFQVGQIYPYYERRSIFRFSVGRTF